MPNAGLRAIHDQLIGGIRLDRVDGKTDMRIETPADIAVHDQRQSRLLTHRIDDSRFEIIGVEKSQRIDDRRHYHDDRQRDNEQYPSAHYFHEVPSARRTPSYFRYMVASTRNVLNLEDTQKICSFDHPYGKRCPLPYNRNEPVIR
ncbi:uncharacterized protein ZBT109_2630 [Zymobacter palmae]|uniref:Uncharacterized protein n=1 Tax=Zymobacter palmae TaxID=33074 RepID=A0A348HIA5_9GAMM|nr:uncharacterized protein ZBT109_2630 [Zymobacter palmae]